MLTGADDGDAISLLSPMMAVVVVVMYYRGREEMLYLLLSVGTSGTGPVKVLRVLSQTRDVDYSLSVFFLLHLVR